MTTRPSRSLGVILAAIGALAGAGVTYFVMRAPAEAPVAREAMPPASQVPLSTGEVSVTLTPEAVARSGIVLAPVESRRLDVHVTLSATVEPDAYKQTVVTTLVPGRVTRVSSELGQQVRRGQVLAEVYSPELAEAKRAFISAAAELQAHELELARTERLASIGSASRQELERAHAEHATLSSGVEGARSRLELLGLSASQVTQVTSSSQMTATSEVRAPLDGVITTRQANVGLNVDTTMPLFTVVDLSSVWVVGKVYEADFARVRLGSRATITFTAFPDLRLEAPVTYIAPDLDRETRTAEVRVSVPNTQGRLRFGMFAEMQIEGDAGGEPLPVVPLAAVQTVGAQSVVYVADPAVPGRFVERPIRTGRQSADEILVVSGLSGGESIVVSGSFFVRAERERLGLTASDRSETAAPGAIQTARVIASEKGFEPGRLVLKPGVPAEITFLRTTDATCAKEVVFPSLDIRRELPLNVSVTVSLTPDADEIGFVCGMNMFRGTVVAQ